MKKRVKIPTKRPVQLLDLAKKVQQRHLADGDASVLKVLDWQTMSPAIDAALQAHEKAERLRREMLEAYQQRDLRIASVNDLVRDSRDILTGAFKKEMKVLGQWGYEVAEVRSSKPVPQTVSDAAVH
jgi:hypothetical protein